MHIAESLEVTSPRRGGTIELDLDLLVDDPTLEEQRGPSVGLEPEAERSLRRARALLSRGALAIGTIGARDARLRFEECLTRAAKSPEHASEAARLRAELAVFDGRTDEAITELKRALHLTRAWAPIFAALSEVYAARGERAEAAYYAKRAGRIVRANVNDTTRSPAQRGRPASPSARAPALR